jgi:hypothetical protein
MGVAVALAAGELAAPSPVEAPGWAGAGTRGVAMPEAGANAAAKAGEGTGMTPIGAD